MTKGDKHSGDYAIGYKKPPRAHQFTKGVSGNPKGRKKGSRGLKSDLKAELEARMTIRINNEPVSDTRQRLLLRALASRAAAGDVRAAAIVIPLIIQVLGIEDRGKDRKTLSPLDQSILDEMLGSLGMPPEDPAAPRYGAGQNDGSDEADQMNEPHEEPRDA